MSPLLALLPLLAPPSEPYRWKSVQMVGAGFVDGVVFHPAVKDVRYARTDMGGAYRWDARARRWMPMLDWMPYADLNLMGVESIAIDPRDPRKVYLACGTYTNPTTPDGAVLRSNDGGRTFAITRVPFKFGGNENGRGNGERMMVDPNDGRTIYLGTRKAGLWRSIDGAASFQKVESFVWPKGDPGRNSAGIVGVLFGQDGAIYVAVSDPTSHNFFRSTDHGATWEPVEGHPIGMVPTHMALAPNGKLFVTYASSPGPSPITNGEVWRFDPKAGTWDDITPDKPDEKRKFGYVGVSAVGNAVIVSTFFYPGGEQIFRSLDEGATWKPVIGGKETYDYSIAPYVGRTGIHWLFDVEIDPANPAHAIFTTGYGGHETFNLTDADQGKPVRWSVMSRGIEESVSLDLESPPKGAALITGIGDYGGAVHWNLDRPAPEGNFTNPHFGNTDSIAVAEKAPNVIVRVGRASGHDVRVNIGYSTDYGRTWQPATVPQDRASSGSIAVSPDGATWVWSLRNATFVTRDRGQTWTEAKGLPAGTRVVADRMNPARFYALSLFDGKLYVSDDGAATFAPRDLRLFGGAPKRGDRGDSRGGQDQLYVTPGRSGDLWVAAFDGLHHSTDDGATFARMAGVQQLHAFGFGKAAPDRSYPALYMVGTLDGQRGIFRSDDAAKSWVRINDDVHQWGLVLLITGDPKKYGRVYVGTHGRGTFYGDPVRR